MRGPFKAIVGRQRGLQRHRTTSKNHCNSSHSGFNSSFGHAASKASPTHTQQLLNDAQTQIQTHAKQLPNHPKHSTCIGLVEFAFVFEHAGVALGHPGARINAPMHSSNSFMMKRLNLACRNVGRVGEVVQQLEVRKAYVEIVKYWLPIFGSGYAQIR